MRSGRDKIISQKLIGAHRPITFSIDNPSNSCLNVKPLHFIGDLGAAELDLVHFGWEANNSIGEASRDTKTHTRLDMFVVVNHNNPLVCLALHDGGEVVLVGFVAEVSEKRESSKWNNCVNQE